MVSTPVLVIHLPHPRGLCVPNGIKIWMILHFESPIYSFSNTSADEGSIHPLSQLYIFYTPGACGWLYPLPVFMGKEYCFFSYVKLMYQSNQNVCKSVSKLLTAESTYCSCFIWECQNSLKFVGRIIVKRIELPYLQKYILVSLNLGHISTTVQWKKSKNFNFVISASRPIWHCFMCDCSE